MKQIQCTITFIMKIDDSGKVKGEDYSPKQFAKDIIHDIEEGWSEVGDEVICVSHAQVKARIHNMLSILNDTSQRLDLLQKVVDEELL